MYVLPFFSLFIVTTAKVMLLFDTSKQFISFFTKKGNNFLLLAIFRVWNVTKIIKKEEDQGNHQKRKRQREDHRQDLPRYSYENL